MTAPTPSPEEFANAILSRSKFVTGREAQRVQIAKDVAARDAALLAPLREQVTRLDALVVTHLNEANAQADRAERAEAENARLLAHTNALLESAAENANEVTRLDAEVARLRAALQQTHGALVILLDEFSPQHMDSVSGTSVGRHAVEARNAAARALAPAAEGGTQG